MRWGDILVWHSRQGLQFGQSGRNCRQLGNLCAAARRNTAMAASVSFPKNSSAHNTDLDGINIYLIFHWQFTSTVTES